MSEFEILVYGNDRERYYHGSILRSSKPPVDHYMILSGYDEHGEPWVIHNSKQYGVVEEPLSDALARGPESQAFVLGVPTQGVAPEIAIANARRYLGRKWEATNNCEHFWREAYEIKKESPQLRRFIAGTIVLFGTFFLLGSLSTGNRNS